ncbi:hypothetical protein CWI36_2146p0010 [Hamiltosporidium magnivora]|uniref:Uncharacterized protein n=1 Tax=Hamiltosporidium magnivora TaxID=148818 RepID=A0A4Q9KVP5_9MICR|nr:hypothetical protein CWI36_2146p0010 [Hamiltosporidium magnivora]
MDKILFNEVLSCSRFFKIGDRKKIYSALTGVKLTNKQKEIIHEILRKGCVDTGLIYCDGSCLEFKRERSFNKQRESVVDNTSMMYKENTNINNTPLITKEYTSINNTPLITKENNHYNNTPSTNKENTTMFNTPLNTKENNHYNNTPSINKENTTMFNTPLITKENTTMFNTPLITKENTGITKTLSTNKENTTILNTPLITDEVLEKTKCFCFHNFGFKYASSLQKYLLCCLFTKKSLKEVLLVVHNIPSFLYLKGVCLLMLYYSTGDFKFAIACYLSVRRKFRKIMEISNEEIIKRLEGKRKFEQIFLYNNDCKNMEIN